MRNYGQDKYILTISGGGRDASPGTIGTRSGSEESQVTCRLAYRRVSRFTASIVSGSGTPSRRCAAAWRYPRAIIGLRERSNPLASSPRTSSANPRRNISSVRASILRYSVSRSGQRARNRHPCLAPAELQAARARLGGIPATAAISSARRTRCRSEGWTFADVSGSMRAKLRVERRPPLGFPTPRELLPDARVRGERVQPPQQRADVHPRPADQHRDLSQCPDLPDRPLRLPDVPPGVVRLVGIRHVDQVVGDLAPLRHGGLRGADVEVPVHLEGIGVDDLHGEFARQGEGQGRFPRGRRAGEDDDPFGDHPVR